MLTSQYHSFSHVVFLARRIRAYDCQVCNPVMQSCSAAMNLQHKEHQYRLYIHRKYYAAARSWKYTREGRVHWDAEVPHKQEKQDTFKISKEQKYLSPIARDFPWERNYILQLQVLPQRVKSGNEC